MLKKNVLLLNDELVPQASKAVYNLKHMFLQNKITFNRYLISSKIFGE